MSYTYNIISGNDITITGWNGNSNIINKQFYEDSGLNGLTILSITNNAFFNKGYTFVLTNLVLPASLTSIGANAYRDATGITGIVDFSITNLTTINNDSFRGCTKLSGTLSFPSTLNYIGIGSFFNCTGFSGQLDLSNLTQLENLYNSTFAQCKFSSLELPVNLRTLGGFENCTQLLGNLDLSTLSQLTTLYQNAFLNCNKYNGTLTLPSSLNDLGLAGTFFSCNFTGTLDLSNTAITTIPGDNFYNCNFDTLLLPSLTSIGIRSFSGVSFTSVYFQSGCILQTNSFSKLTSAIVYANTGDTFKVGTGTGIISPINNPLTFFSKWRLYNQPYPTELDYFTTSINTFYKYFIANKTFDIYTYSIATANYSVVVYGDSSVYATFPVEVIPIQTINEYQYKLTFSVPTGSKELVLKNGTTYTLVLNLIETQAITIDPLNASYNIGETMVVQWQGYTTPYRLLLTGPIPPPPVIVTNILVDTYTFDIPNVEPGQYVITITNEDGFANSNTFIILPCITISPMKQFYFGQLFIEWVGFSPPYILSLVGLDGTSYPITTTSSTEYIWVIPNTVTSGLYQVQIEGGGCTVLSNRFFILTLQDICFVKDTLVETDQGNIPIQHLIPGKHTIFKERIMRVTMSVHIDTHLVHIRAFAFGSYPTKDTIVSQEHKINGIHSFREAREYVNGTTVTLIPYDKEPLYNVLLSKRGFMKVHGMMAETLDPNCNIALADKTKRLLQINI